MVAGFPNSNTTTTSYYNSTNDTSWMGTTFPSITKSTTYQSTSTTTYTPRYRIIEYNVKLPNHWNKKTERWIT